MTASSRIKVAERALDDAVREVYAAYEEAEREEAERAGQTYYAGGTVTRWAVLAGAVVFAGGAPTHMVGMFYAEDMADIDILGLIHLYLRDEDARALARRLQQ